MTTGHLSCYTTGQIMSSQQPICRKVWDWIGQFILIVPIKIVRIDLSSYQK